MTKTAIFVTAACLAWYAAMRKLTQIFTQAEAGTLPKQTPADPATLTKASQYPYTTIRKHSIWTQ